MHNRFISEGVAAALIGPAAKAALKQALVWGGSSALGSRLSSGRAKSKKKRKEQIKQMVISGLTGAGALGSYLSR